MKVQTLLATALLAGASQAALATQSASGGVPLTDVPMTRKAPEKPPFHPADPACEIQPAPSGPESDRLIFTGSLAQGSTAVSQVGSVYTLRFDGDESIEYRIDVADPLVASGRIRIFEAESDAYPIARGGVSFRDAGGNLRDESWLAQFTTLVSESHDADSVTLVYEDHVEGVHRREHRFELIGKSLRVTVRDLNDNRSYKSNYSGLALGRTEGTENPRMVRMQGTLANPIILFENGAEHFYCANQLDLFWSNASAWYLEQGEDILPTADSIEFAYETDGFYYALTDGTLAEPLHEEFNVIVSTRIADVLVDSTAPAAPYREATALRSTIMFTGAFTTWEEYKQELQLFYQWGMRDLATYFFAWWSDSNNGDSWHLPAKDEPGYKAIREDPEAAEFLIGEYTKYWKNWHTSPFFSVHDIPLDSTGFPKGDQLAESARLRHAILEATALKEEYGSNLAYQDVLTYASPTLGIGTDDLTQRADSPWAKTVRQGCLDRKIWLDIMREILDGPMLGEASIATQNSNTEWLWYGYVDSVQRTINSGGSWVSADLPYGDPHAPTLWPVIPEYELRVAAPKMTNHGNAFYQRFFSWADEDLFVGGVVPSYPLPEAAQDRYRAYSVTYAHGTYVQTNGPFNGIGDYLTFADILRDHYLLNGLQRRFFSSPIKSIEYPYQGALRTFDEVLFDTGTTDAFLDPRIRLEYENGTVILVNHNPTPWDIDFEGVDFVLPEDSFFAYQPGSDFIAFSAIPDAIGERVDYAFVPGEYEMFDGRGVAAGYGGIQTTTNLFEVRYFPLERTIREEPNGDITTQSGPPPALERIVVTLGDGALGLGERTTARAVGIYSNASRRDLTLITELVSSKPKLVKVRDSGVVTTHCIGEATITPVVPDGVIAVPAVINVLP